jgi:hypothetical protein
MPDSRRQNAPVVESCYLDKVYIETIGNQVSQKLLDLHLRSVFLDKSGGCRTELTL